MARGPALIGAIAEFRIGPLLAAGSTGSVYLAEDMARGGRVALKVLLPALEADERFRVRFLRESRAAAAIDNPHVVRTVASGEADGVLYLAMEQVEGRDLRQVIRAKGALDPARAVAIVEQIAEGLDAAHAAGLVHRDVKPANILLEPRLEGEHAAICDFGLARHVASVSSLTGDRGFVGTIDYVAPEQIEGRTVDGRADVYALGCVLFECLTGEKPFARESELAVVFAHLNERAPLVSEFAVPVPAAFDDVIGKALAKRPEARYPTCSALAAAARDALAGRLARGKRRRRRLVLGGACAALAAAAGTLALAMGDSSQTSATVYPEITQASIHGARLGLPAGAYERLLVPQGVRPGFGRAKDLDSGYTSLWFGRMKVAVYFPPGATRAAIITTWNGGFRTAAGIGPCSTIEEMKEAYGNAVQPTWAGTSPDGKTVWSWAVGNGLVFNSENHRTITAVALYRGDPADTKGGSPQAWANYISANERWCS